MGNGITFDTLAFSKHLRAGGFTRQQSETLAAAFEKTTQNKPDRQELDGLATKTDINEVKGEIKKEIAALELRLTKTLYSALAGFAAVIATVTIGAISVAVLFLK